MAVIPALASSSQAPAAPVRRLPTPLRWLGRGVAWLVGLLLAAWAFGAIWYDGPLGNPFGNNTGNLLLGLFWLVLVGLALWRVRRYGWAVAAALWLAVLLPWLQQKPTDDRDWPPELDRTAWAEQDGDRITLHNVRDFIYRKGAAPEPRWVERTVHLHNLRGMDLFQTYWGSAWIAHTIVSFDFGSEGHLAFSIETRPDRTETYSAIAGLYRRYELIYVVAEERDVIRLRTNYRKDEEVYLYRLRVSAQDARHRFLGYITELNVLHQSPRFYNVLTANCTTSIRSQTAPWERPPFHWQMLLNGKLDGWLYGQGAIVSGGLPFAELKERSHINAKGHAADADPAYSERIREGLPGEENAP